MPDLFDYCIAFTLKNEGGFYQNAITGECSNFGISLRWLKGIKPDATADDIRNLTQDTAIALYRQYFWNRANLGLIQLPLDAARVFDLEVNMGQTEGVRLLQAALSVNIDGIIGQVTATQCNAASEQCLHADLVMLATARYQMIHDAEVQKYGQALADKNLKTWLDRLATNPPPYVAQPA